MTEQGADWTALVLAAGRSSRMGPQHKLLEDLHGKPVIRHVIDHVRAAHFSSLVLVTGYRAQEVCAAAGDVLCVENCDYENGMASSLQAGLAQVPAHSAGIFVLLGDMPFIRTTQLNRMIRAINAAPASVALVPVVGGEWAHPVAIRRSLFPQLAALTGDKGARALLKSRQDEVLLWPSDDRSLLFDLDTPDALAEARERFDMLSH